MNTLALESLDFTDEEANQLVSSFNVSNPVIYPGMIELVSSNDHSGANLSDLLSYSCNKMGAIKVYLTLTVPERTALVTLYRTVRENRDVVGSELEVAIQNYKIGNLLFGCEYVMKGSLYNTLEGGIGMTQIWREGTNIDPEKLTIENWFGHKEFVKLKYKSFLMNFKSLLEQLPSELKARFTLSNAGHRMMTIVHGVKAFFEENGKDPYPLVTHDFFHLYFLPPVVDNKVNLATHPDHLANSNQNCAKRIYAELGKVIVDAGLSIDDFANTNTKLILLSIRNSMKAKLCYVRQSLPEHNDFLRMYRDEYAIRN
jgi:hypothetical protein